MFSANECCCKLDCDKCSCDKCSCVKKEDDDEIKEEEEEELHNTFPFFKEKEKNIEDQKSTIIPTKMKIRIEDALKFDDELEKKIEDTIESIQDESASAREKVAHSFIEAHEKLKNEEARVMEELENVCNEAEEVLQNALVSIRDVREHNIALSEASIKDNKSAKINMECEMEKQLHTMEELHKMTLTSLNIEWDDSGRKLSFVKHLINGVPVPDSIVFPAVHGRNIDISWNCDSENSHKINGENNTVTYCVEIKKSSDNKGCDEWKEVYSGKEKNCNVTGLKMGTEYGVRVKCVIGELNGGWSDVVNVRTKDRIKIDSMILQEKNKEYFIEKIWSDND